MKTVLERIAEIDRNQERAEIKEQYDIIVKVAYIGSLQERGYEFLNPKKQWKH